MKTTFTATALQDFDYNGRRVYRGETLEGVTPAEAAVMHYRKRAKLDRTVEARDLEAVDAQPEPEPTPRRRRRYNRRDLVAEP